MGALREPKLIKLSHIEKISEVFDEPCLEVRTPQNMFLYSKVQLSYYQIYAIMHRMLFAIGLLINRLLRLMDPYNNVQHRAIANSFLYKEKNLLFFFLCKEKY